MEKKKVTSVPIDDWGLTFGYGLFETLRIYHGIPFLVEAHVDRLLNSCRELSFTDIPDKETLIQLINQYIKKLNLPRGARTLYAAQTVCEDFHSSPGDGAYASLPQNENSYITNLPPGGGALYAAQTVCEDFHSSPDDGAYARLPQNENSYITNLNSRAVRLSITYGNEAEGISSTIFLSNRAIPYRDSDYREGIKAASSPYRKNEYSPIVQHKTFNQLENIFSLRHCREKDAKECIFLNSSGFLAEGSKSNLFFIREGKVYTPSADCGILPGITRQQVMDLLTGQGIAVMEGKYHFNELVESDECFCTNSLMEVMPVVKIDDRRIGSGYPGELTRFALNLYGESVARGDYS
jgi:branched-subunit amino acid aminotransferase/4-amino-4-deoxychorismate lyase